MGSILGTKKSVIKDVTDTWKPLFYRRKKWRMANLKKLLQAERRSKKPSLWDITERISLNPSRKREKHHEKYDLFQKSYVICFEIFRYLVCCSTVFYIIDSRNGVILLLKCRIFVKKYLFDIQYVETYNIKVLWRKV